MEIEKKFLVKYLPEHLDTYEHIEIEQCYLCTKPTIRIRRWNEQYILTYKNRTAQMQSDSKNEKVCICDEVELALTEESYLHLKEKADGKKISKTRYLIPFQQLTIELDVFHDDYDGFFLAEVEFESVEESQKFVAPAWFGTDVSGDYHYSNSYLSSQK